MRPLIGVTTSEMRLPRRTHPLPEGDPPQSEMALGIVYARAVEQAGGLPVVLPPLDAQARSRRWSTAWRASACPAGPDLDPAAYEADPAPASRPDRARRSTRSSSPSPAAPISVGLPVLGICRGCQALNVARGGTLHQHLPDVTDGSITHRQTESGRQPTHTVRIEPGSRLAAIVGAEELDVNSFHHQAVDRLGRGLRAVAWAPDGVIEGSRTRTRRCTWACSGTSRRSCTSTRHAALFEALVEAAARPRASSGPRSRVRIRRRDPPRRAAGPRRARAHGRRRSRRAGPTAPACGSTARPGFVHRRLAIIDLSERGAQPMRDDALGLTVVFNGCIYNHRELRAELERLGHAFVSTSDTEVLLKGWAQWGERMLDRLAGMFAFALFEDSGRLVLARDRLGVKPLYLAELPGGGLRAASSLPALVRAGGVDTVGRSGRAAPLPELALDRARAAHDPARRRQAPARDGAGDRAGRIAARAPLVGSRRSTACCSPPDWTEAVREALRVAVRRRMVADVPVGILLSGGLDSSLIVALLAEQGQRGLATFSIGFPDAGGREGNEFAFSDLVAREFATEHRQIRVRAGADRRGAAGGDRRDERADGLPRRGRVLAAERGRGARAQGRAVRPGRRRGVRRLLLVPAAAGGGGRRAGHLRAGVLRPRPRADRRAGGAGVDGATRTSRARSRRSGSRGRAPPRRWTAGCGSTPR